MHTIYAETAKINYFTLYRPGRRYAKAKQTITRLPVGVGCRVGVGVGPKRKM